MLRSPGPRRRTESDDTPTQSEHNFSDNATGSEHPTETVPQVVTLWIHDDTFSKEDVLINENLFGKRISADSVLEITALKTTSSIRDFENQSFSTPDRTGIALGRSDDENWGEQSVLVSGLGVDVDPSIRYLCNTRVASPDVVAKHPQLQVSIAGGIAARFGFRSRSQVLVSVADVSKNSATHVELGFRDAYLSRSDMWRMTSAELAGRAVYIGQKVQFLGSLRATVKGISIGNHKVSTAFFSGETIPVFRSEAARYVLFIQMSREMWDFDSEGNGEILFNRVVNGFLPELFNRWSELEVKHLVTIVMFGRVMYGQDDSSFPNLAKEDLERSGSKPESPDIVHKDFYRVVVTDMASSKWTTILDELKKHFRVFLRDVCLDPTSLQHPNSKENGATTVKRITGRPSTALKGNILEAINIAASQFSSDHIDRDLVRTGISVVVVTAASGVFEVDQNLLNLTSENLTNNGIGIDVVCLSKMPLHSAPLFKYRPAVTSASVDSQPIPSFSESPGVQGASAKSLDHAVGRDISTSKLPNSTSPSNSLYSSSIIQDKTRGWCHGIPQWIDLSYWSPESERKSMMSQVRRGSAFDGEKTPRNKRFVPRVRMYELQMMGLMELGLADIAIPYMQVIARNGKRTRRSKGSGVFKVTKSDKGSLSASPTQTRRYTSRQLEISTNSTSIISNHAEQHRRTYDRMTEYDQAIFDIHGQNSASGEPAQRNSFAVYSSTEAGLVPGNERKGPVRARESEKENLQSSGKSSDPVPPQGLNPKPGFSRPQPGASRSSRTISLAFGGFGQASRAVASTGVNIETVSAQPSLSRPSRLDRVPTSSSASILSLPRPDTSEGLGDEGKRDTSANGKVSGNISSPITIQTPGKTSRFREDEKNVQENNSKRTTKSGSRASSPADNYSDSPSSEDDSFSIIHSTTAAMPETSIPFIRNVNPANPIKKDPNAASLYGRWQHLYPRKPRAATVKWKSLCTPASVPLTTQHSLSLHDLETDFSSMTYSIARGSSNELLEVPHSRETMLQEMLSMRLSHGYQLIVQSALTDSGSGSVCNSPTFFRPTRLTKDSDTIYLSMGNTIQKLSYGDDSSVQVTKYVRNPTSDSAFQKSLHYLPYIRTILSQEYIARPLEFSGFAEEYPWELADQYLAGSKKNPPDAVQKLRFWRARFVLIPVDPPPSAYKLAPSMNDENEEEIHLRGITSLTQTWQRQRYIPPEDRKFKPTTKRRDLNPLEINFQTLNPSEVVATELDKLQMTEDPGELHSMQLLPESELLERETSNLPKIAQAMQGDKGIEIKNRRWHLRLHYNCFRGEDFINWTLESFKDIEDRDAAVDFGNELMEHGLFHHVSSRHAFKDGHFFYSLDPKYHIPKSEGGKSWFSGSRRPDKSVPPTPAADNAPRDSPLSVRSRSGSNAGTDDSETLNVNPTRSSGDKKRVSVSLSKIIRIDVDQRKRSKRREVVNLHYDRLHNPENCYHLELSWLNVTSKLVEDAIVSWAAQSERYGLKLVEVPIAEASEISTYEPFRAPYRVKLAVQPPEKPAFSNGILTANAFGLQPAPNNPEIHHTYQKLLLKRFNFVLDLESKSEFPEDVDILYSWGKLEYKYTQFVHRSGVILAQITDEGDFLLLANRLYNTRYAASKDITGKFDSKAKEQNRISTYLQTPSQRPQQPLPQPSGILPSNQQHQSQHVGGGHQQTNASSPSPAIAPTPLLRATADSYLPPTPSTRHLLSQQPSIYQSSSHHHVTPEQIKDDMDNFCHDPVKLEAFYNEILSSTTPSTTAVASQQQQQHQQLQQVQAARRAVGSGSSSAMRPRDADLLDASIPDIQLPPRLVLARGSVGGGEVVSGNSSSDERGAPTTTAMAGPRGS